MSDIKAKKLSCPCCDAPLHLKDTGYGEVKCDYCGASVYISREDTDKEGNARILNESDNRPLATLNVPIGWDVVHRYIDDSVPTTEYPYSINIDISNNTNSTIHIQSGQAYQTIGMMGYNNRQDEFTVQSDFCSVEQYMDNMAASYADPRNYKVVSCENRALPVEDVDKKALFESYKRKVEDDLKRLQMTANGYQIGIVGVYSDTACRVYHLQGENGDKKVIVFYTGVEGQKMKILGIENLMAGVHGMMGMLGGIFGNGLFNNGQTQNSSNQNSQSVNVQSEYMQGNLNHPGEGETLAWKSSTIFMLVSNEEEFENVYENAFKGVCSSFKIDPNVNYEYAQLKSQMEQLTRNNINNEYSTQQQNLARLQQASRNLSQAYQRSTEAMMKRSNQAYERDRASYNSRMAAGDRMREKQSEAIRGVNTYIKPDGKEVEVSVSSDTVWINEKGDIVGGGKGFNPGFGWKELKRKN